MEISIVREGQQGNYGIVASSDVWKKPQYIIQDFWSYEEAQEYLESDLGRAQVAFKGVLEKKDRFEKSHDFGVRLPNALITEYRAAIIRVKEGFEAKFGVGFEAKFGVGDMLIESPGNWVKVIAEAGGSSAWETVVESEAVRTGIALIREGGFGAVRFETDEDEFVEDGYGGFNTTPAGERLNKIREDFRMALEALNDDDDAPQP
jgi:hypothetical protein